MSVATALAIIDNLIFANRGKHLNDLQVDLIRQVWQGEKYVAIAENLGYTEGHIKDIAALLWQELSEILTEKVTKNNLRSIIARQVNNHESIDSNDYSFIGREKALDQLNFLTERDPKIVVIQGEGGVGKTTLAQQYFQQQN
jgi:DNA-binding NtrC family response regulator